MRKAKTHRLPNGFRVIVMPLADFHSVTTLLAIKSGSRYEAAKEGGITHFLEHMVFKGTKRYPSTAQIAQALEGVGGSFNAWTSVDHTVYYNTVPMLEWRTGLEIPFELGYGALLRAEDLERERGVIVEEMRMIKDDPARYVFDLSNEIVFADHQLGRPIIGSEATIRSLQIEDLIRYRDAHYSLNQSVLAVVGNFKEDQVLDEISQLTDSIFGLKTPDYDRFERQSQPKLKIFEKKTDQTHLVLALSHPILKLGSSDLDAAKVMNAILGEGMSSRLFLKVREEKGLAYSIRSGLSDLEETGVFEVSGGISTGKIIEALDAVELELTRLTKEAVGQDELNKAKRYLIGGYDIRSDRPFGIARFHALGELFSAQEEFDAVKQRIAAVTADDISRVAKELFLPKNRTLTVIGPYKTESPFKRFVGLS